MRRASSAVAVISAIVVSASSLPAHAGLSADSVRVLKGDRGEEIAIVVLQPAADGNAVCRFAGTGSVLDGMALPCKRRSDERDELYSSEWRGRSFAFVQADLRRGAPRWQLYVPGALNRARPLHLDEAAGKALKPKEVLSPHEKQQKDGTLARFAAFNRAEEQAAHDQEIAEAAAAATKACGAPVAARIDWSKVDDEMLKRLSIASFCSPPISQVAAICGKSPGGAALMRELVKQITCHLPGAEQVSLVRGQLEWTVNADSANLDDLALGLLYSAPVEPVGPLAAGAPPWQRGETVLFRLILAGTSVCSDDKNHVVALTPSVGEFRNVGPELYYGDGKKLVRVATNRMLGSGTFFEPRFVNPTANPSFRGADVRLYSSVEVDAAKGTCEVQCGTRKTALKVVPAADAQKLLIAASYGPPLLDVTPHALVRDDKGNYYYVDKGNTPETERKFRLFVGPKGNLKLQAMTNVVSDSKGQIFTTKMGELRFVVGPGGAESMWIAGRKKTRLTAVPVEDNWQLIFTDLGVYGGVRLGTPCDDL